MIDNGQIEDLIEEIRKKGCVHADVGPLGGMGRVFHASRLMEELLMSVAKLEVSRKSQGSSTPEL